MIIHYDTREAAVSHLLQNGWSLLKSGNWVSRDGTCRASIHPIAGRPEVAIFYSEIE